MKLTKLTDLIPPAKEDEGYAECRDLIIEAIRRTLNQELSYHKTARDYYDGSNSMLHKDLTKTVEQIENAIQYILKLRQ